MFLSNRILVLSLLFAVFPSHAQLRLALRNDPKTFDPLLVDESAGETIRYLTGGVLVRLNRVTQKLGPELAKSWKISDGGRKLTLELRDQILFSDGTPFTANDVVFTLERMMDPALVADGRFVPVGSGKDHYDGAAADTVVITFPAPVASLDRLLDQVVIQSERSPGKGARRSRPFMLPTQAWSVP